MKIKLIKSNELKEEEPEILSTIGEENEEELKTDYLKKLTDVVTWSTDWTVDSLIGQLKRGNIELDPKFQRRDAWNPTKKSRLIESLIYGLPIPQLVLAEDKSKKGRFIVVDGKQRLITLLKFCKSECNAEEQDNLVLTGLKDSKLNGLSYDDLKDKFPEYYESFLNQSIRSVIIKNWPSDNLLYTIFFRLNTGSLTLSPQELRRALKPGPFMDFVDDFSQSSAAIKTILGLTEPDFRMRDIDLVIRYYAFRNYVNTYKGDYKSFLDETCEKLNHNWKASGSAIIAQSKELDIAIKLCIGIFGKRNVFRKWNGNKYEGRMNRAIFDIVMYYFTNSKNINAIKKNAQLIKNSFNSLCETNNSFQKSIGSNTNNIIETSTRFVLWGKEMGKYDKTIEVPSHLQTHYNKFVTK